MSGPLSNQCAGIEKSQIILFDGECNLCNRWVRFVIARDPLGKFRFTSIQSKSGQDLLRKYGLSASDMDSLVLVSFDGYFIRSTAGLRILKELGGCWKFFYILRMVPLPLRDFVYNWIAKSRYRIFGKRDSCMIPTIEVRARFLE